MILKIITPLIAVLVLAGCAPKQFEKKAPSYITIKTKNLKYSDMGFIYSTNSYIKAQIYKFGNPVFELKMHSNICVDSACFNYDRFNEEFLHTSYPKHLIKDIFLAKPIYNKKGFKALNGGFEQIFETNDASVQYRVNQDLIRFHDKKNNILIKIKRLGE